MTDKETISEWCMDYSCTEENLFVRKLRAKGFNDSEIVSILETLDSVCRYCFNSDSRCYCMRDD